MADTTAREVTLADLRWVLACTFGQPRRCVRCGAVLDPLAAGWRWTRNGWHHDHRGSTKGGQHAEMDTGA